MNVPCLVWLQDPWSPAGYDVVELADEAAPANRPPDRREIPKTPRSPLGYRVVELNPPPAPELPGTEEVLLEDLALAELALAPAEELSGATTTPDRAVKSHPRQPRRRWRWAARAAVGSCLALAIVLVLVRLQAQARSVRPAQAPAQEVKLLGEPAAVPGDFCPVDRQGSGRETFGTAVEFVRNAPEAGRIADEQHKLTCLLHVSGNFEDSGFT